MLFLGPLFCFVAYVWALTAFFTWKGRRWRTLAAMPYIGVLLYGLVVLLPAWAEDKTSHNLWPFEIGMLFWPSLPYMAVLAAFHRASVESTAGEGPR
jgi:hypothetical protein